MFLRCLQVVDAFLHIKGVRDSDVVHDYFKPVKGFGICPTLGGNGCCLGYHKLTIGKHHFKVEKLSGGGLQKRASSAGCCGESEQLAGQVNVVTWVHTHRQGKDCARKYLLQRTSGTRAGQIRL